MEIEDRKHLLEFNRQFKLNLIPNDFLGGRIPISIMLSRAKMGLTSVEKLNEQFENLIYNLQIAKNRAIEIINESSVCEHEYSQATYTIEESIVGFSHCYKRSCIKCTHLDSVSKHCDDYEKELPDWILSAKKLNFTNY